MKKLSLTFKLLVIELIPQEDLTGDCLKGVSITFKLLLIEQITLGKLAERYLIPNV